MEHATLSIALSAAALGSGTAALLVAVLRKRNHIHDELRKQLDEAIDENTRLIAESKKLADELHAAKVKVSPELLQKYADMAIATAEQVAAPDATGKDKLRAALDALKKLDEGDNGVRDWSDAEHRIAIEAALRRGR